jgi:hypothetical protein
MIVWTPTHPCAGVLGVGRVQPGAADDEKGVT